MIWRDLPALSHLVLSKSFKIPGQVSTPHAGAHGLETQSGYPVSTYGGFLKWGYPPSHPFFIGFSIFYHLYWGTPIYGNPHVEYITVYTVM